MDIKLGDICVANAGSPYIGFVGKDHGGGYYVDRNTCPFVVVANGGDYGSHLCRIASHVI